MRVRWGVVGEPGKLGAHGVELALGFEELGLHPADAALKLKLLILQFL